MSSSIKKQAVNGTIWTLVGYGGSQGLRFVGNLILTRLLVPELFGLMALVNTFQMGLILFSDIGIRPSIIRSPRSTDPDFLNTAWTLQGLRGGWIWLGCWLIAWPVSQFYGDPRLLWLVPLVGITGFLTGFNSTAMATLLRDLQVAKLTIFEFIVQAIGLTVMVIWAYLSPSIWALVAGNLLTSVLKMVGSHFIDPNHQDRLAWDKAAVKEILSFGVWVFVATGMMFLANQADRLILGKLFTLELLGIYVVAFTLADLPRQIVQRLSRQIIFPVISKYAKELDRQSLRQKILHKRWFLLMGLSLLVTALVCFGDLLILTLYDDRYGQAAWMLPILALGLWPLILSITVDQALYAIGNPKFTALGNFLKFGYMLFLLPFSYNQFGMLGAIIVVAFNDLPFYIPISFGLWREKLSCIGQDLIATLLLVGLITGVLFIRYSLGLGLPLDELQWNIAGLGIVT
jgi:O-antigen/teichoic acid export membrane protein